MTALVNTFIDINTVDTYADDLLEVFKHLNLKNVMMVGHSTGGGEVIRFCARHGHGTDLVSKAVIVGAIPPVMIKKESNPGGLPKEVFDSFRSGMTTDRAQFFIDVPTGPFFGYNRPGAKASHGLIQSWYQQGMMCGFKNAYDCIKVFSETDFTEDMKKLDIPVLIIHGEDDQIVPIGAAALLGIKLLKKGTLKVYPGGAHALPNTEVDQINKDLLDFAKS